MGIALDTATQRADFIEKAHNPNHIRYLDGMIRSSNRQNDNLFPKGWDGKNVATDLQRTAAKAELFTMSRDMMDLVVHAAKSLPPQTIEMFDLPSAEGWLHLPVPFSFPDVRGMPIPVHTIMWSRRVIGQTRKQAANLRPQEEGVLIYFFSDITKYDDPALAALTPEEYTSLILGSPAASVWGGMTVAFGAEVWDTVDSVEGSRHNVNAVRNGGMRSIHDFEAVYDQAEDGSFTGTTMDGNTVRVLPNPLIQFLKTYWHFCQSELTEIDKEDLPRQFRRAQQRKQMPHGPVSIVQLRRKKYEAKGGGGWELQYRYIRRGHWRRQKYGSKGSEYYRHIFIAATVVGKDDAPWRDSLVVNTLVR